MNICYIISYAHTYNIYVILFVCLHVYYIICLYMCYIILCVCIYVMLYYMRICYISHTIMNQLQ